MARFTNKANRITSISSMASLLAQYYHYDSNLVGLVSLLWQDCLSGKRI